MRAAHPLPSTSPTDFYYTNLANQLLERFLKLRIDFGLQTASTESNELLYDDTSVSTSAMLYFLDNDFLPDLYHAPILSRAATRQQLQADIRFLLRNLRREAY